MIVLTNSTTKKDHRFTISTEDNQRIIDMWNRGLSMSEIGKKTGRSSNGIKLRLKKAGFSIEKRNPRGSSNHLYKSGKYIHKGGYIAIRKENCPIFNAMKNSTGYVFEHRYVMAQYLNRPLENYETVHHIDGNRSNNKLGNLQLRLGKHGYGQVFKCLDCGSCNVQPQPLGENK